MAANMERLSGTDVFKKRKGLLITPERCIACRACQTACKEWNKLPAEETRNRGGYENPPDLTPHLYNKIRFVELSEDSKLSWLFISRRCMHCGLAGCIQICPAPGALFRTKDGLVVFDKDKCIGCKLCQAGCPFDVPRYDANDRISKCHMCEDRVPYGLEPACSKACPTNAIRFGDRDELASIARGEGYKTVYGEGREDLQGLGVLYAFREAPEHYGFSSSPDLPASVAFWRTVMKPLSLIGLGASVAAVAAHYISVGPKEVHPAEGEEEKKEGGERS
jgi:formate dehydrogenase iron-sulfur subunit